MGLLITKTDVENLISGTGVDNLTDDGVEDTIVDQMIEYAEGNIFGKLAYKYTPTTLALSPVIKQIATYFTAFYLSERRGNPSYYQEQMDNANKMLDALRDGGMELVDALGVQLGQDNLSHLGISMQNMIVDESDQDNRIRTRTESSVQTANTNPYVNQTGFSGFWGR